MPARTNAALAALIIENATGHAVVTLTADGVITGWMGGAEAITGYTAEEAIGRNFVDLYTAPDQAAGRPLEEIAKALADGRSEDTRWHQRKNGERFWANGLTMPIRGSDPPTLVKIFRDETAAKMADEHRILLLHELNHRVKNTLATVQSIVEHTLRAAAVPEAVRHDLTSRLLALSRAHNVLVDQNWAGADLETLVVEVLRAHDRVPSPFRLDGPPVRLHPSQAVTLSMALHELATNALKYGALTTAAGSVEVSWNLAQDSEGARHLVLLWRERGGPSVVQPTRRGFGSRLIQQAFESQPGSRTRLDFSPEGLVCTIELRLLEEAPATVPAAAAAADG